MQENILNLKRLYLYIMNNTQEYECKIFVSLMFYEINGVEEILLSACLVNAYIVL